MAEGVFSRINRALKGARDRHAGGEGVERKALDLDDEMRKKREEERRARARAERLKQMGLSPEGKAK